jgi:hypothetical protein
MASSKIQVVIDVNTQKVTFAGGEVKNLRQQAKLLNDELQKTKAGTDQYQILVEAIGDVEDATRRAKTATQEIYGTLGSLPGPIGDITNNANKMVDTFKTLGTLKTTELRAQFVTLGKDLKDAGQGLLNITGFSKVYQGVLEKISSAERAKAAAMKAATAAEQAETAASQASTVANKEQAVSGAAAAAATTAEATAAKVNAASQVTQATAMQGASLAAKGLAASMALIPFVAIAIAVTYLTTQLMSLFDETEKNERAQKAYNDEIERFNEINAKRKQQIDERTAGIKLEATQRLGRALTEKEAFEIEERAAQGKIKADQNVLNATKQSLEFAKIRKEDTKVTAELEKIIKEKTEEIDKQISDSKVARDNFETKELERQYAKRDEADKKLQDDKKQRDQKTAARIEKEKEQRKKALEEITKAEADAFKETLDQREKEQYEVNQKYSALAAEAIKYGQDTKILEEARLAAIKKLTDKYAEEDVKKKEEAEKLAKDNANKLLDIQKSLNNSTLDALKSGTEKEKAEARKSGEDKIAAFKKQLQEAQDLKLLTAEEVAMKLAEFTKNVNDAIQNQIDDVDKKDLAKKLDDRLKLLQIQSEGLLAGTQAYFDNRRAIINASEEKELEDTELTEAEKTAIQQKYSNQRKQLREQEIASIGQTISATIDAVANLTSALASGYDEEAKTSRDAFEKRKKLQIATATMSAASGIIQILTQPSVLPSPFDWIVKGINTAALIAATIININKIKKTEFQAPDSSSSSSSGSAKPIGTTFAKGGLLDGPSHARGGIKTSFGELEGGEYVINRRSTASFLPLLTAINSAGNRKYENGGMMANMDTIQAMLASQPQPIVKTYVVASDMTSQQEANKRLMDLAKI